LPTLSYQPRPDALRVQLLGPGSESDQVGKVTALRSSWVSGSAVTSATPHPEQNFALA